MLHDHETNFIIEKNLSSSIIRFVIPNGINCAEFKVQNATPLEGEPALITIGSVTERKGQLNVINALPAIISKFPSVAYHIVGKPVIKDELMQKMQVLKVEKYVQFYGAVTREKLIGLFGGGTIKMMLSSHTSKGDFEGFGIAVLESG